MRAKQFIQEADLGTNPKRPARAGSRPSRGHEPQERYVTDRKTGKQYDPEEEFDKLKNSPDFQSQMKRMATKESNLEEYGDTAKGQKMLTKVQKRATDRMIKADDQRDAKSAKKNQETANRAWDRMTDKDLEEGSDDRKQNALWAQITAHEKAAKKSKDLKQQHHLKMADQLRSQLKTSDNMSEHMAAMESELEEHGKASRELCKSSKPDSELGASMLASCKSQGLRARDGDKSHKLGKSPKSRVKVGGHKIKGKKYGGPLPDWS